MFLEWFDARKDVPTLAPTMNTHHPSSHEMRFEEARQRGQKGQAKRNISCCGSQIAFSWEK